MRHIIPISGKDSLATALVQKAIDDSLDYEYVFNPTGLELPEIFDWLEKCELHLGKKIERVGKDLKEIIKSYNYFLPSQRSRYCTKESKIQPFVKWIGDSKCKVYYGIRSDESDRVGFNNTFNKNIIPDYPLKTLGIDLRGVYSIINANGLKPPTFYWKRLHDKVIRILCFDPKLKIEEWIFDLLFSWRSRTNCDRCFNQRYYEWVGLLEFHPDLFWNAEEMERLGSENYERDSKILDPNQFILFGDEIMQELKNDVKIGTFTWSSNGIPLKEIAKNKDKYFNERAYKVAKIINDILTSKLFQDYDSQDLLYQTSCGLFCGK